MPGLVLAELVEPAAQVQLKTMVGVAAEAPEMAVQVAAVPADPVVLGVSAVIQLSNLMVVARGAGQMVVALLLLMLRVIMAPLVAPR